MQKNENEKKKKKKREKSYTVMLYQWCELVGRVFGVQHEITTCYQNRVTMRETVQ